MTKVLKQPQMVIVYDRPYIYILISDHDIQVDKNISDKLNLPLGLFVPCNYNHFLTNRKPLPSLIS